MRGGHLHNEVLIAPLEAAARRLGARTHLEHPVSVGSRTLFLDLAIFIGLHRIAVEAELSPARIRNDLRKAFAFRAHELWIVAPNAQRARVFRRALKVPAASSTGTRVFVFTQGQAAQRIIDSFPFRS